MRVHDENIKMNMRRYYISILTIKINFGRSPHRIVVDVLDCNILVLGAETKYGIILKMFFSLISPVFEKNNQKKKTW